MRVLKRIALLCLALLVYPAAAGADPYVITSGGVVLDFEGDGFLFQGEGFSVRTDPFTLFTFFARGSDFDLCIDCDAGDPFDPSFHTGEIAFGPGSATFGATTFTDVALSGTLNFDVTPVPFPSSTANFLNLQAPFTFTGTVHGGDSRGQLFSASFTGAGTVHQRFELYPAGTYSANENQLRFVFEAAPAATPEPGTLLLLGTGAAAIAARARKRHASTQTAA